MVVEVVDRHARSALHHADELDDRFVALLGARDHDLFLLGEDPHEAVEVQQLALVGRDVRLILGVDDHGDEVVHRVEPLDGDTVEVAAPLVVLGGAVVLLVAHDPVGDAGRLADEAGMPAAPVIMELLDREGGVALHDADELDHRHTLSEPDAPVQVWTIPHHRAASLISRIVGGSKSRNASVSGGRSSRRQRRLSRWSRRRILGFVALGVVVAFALGGIAERVVYRDRVLPGVSLSGVEVATKDDSTVSDRVRSRARKLETDPLAVRAGTTDLSLDPAAIDYKVDVAETANAAEEAGRSGNPVGQVVGAVLRRFRDDRVDIVASWNGQKLDAMLDVWDQQLVAGRRDAGLEFQGSQVVEVPPASGLGLKRKETQARIETALREGDRQPVRVPVGPSHPSVGEAAMRDAAARARGILAAPVDLLVNGSSVTISPDQLGSTMTATPKGGALELGIDPAKLHDVPHPVLAGFEAAPIDARFTWSGPIVMIVPSTAGRVVDLAGPRRPRSSPVSGRCRRRWWNSSRRATPIGHSG